MIAEKATKHRIEEVDEFVLAMTESEKSADFFVVLEAKMPRRSFDLLAKNGGISDEKRIAPTDY